MLSVIQWVSKIPFDLVRQIATEFDLNPLLLAAMIMQESGGVECAMRYEPRWRYEWQTAEFAKMVGSSRATEIIGQKTSWGPLQLMGTVARENGFDGWFPELCDFDIGTYYGAKVLAKQRDRYPEINDAISAYNQGNNRKWTIASKKATMKKWTLEVKQGKRRRMPKEPIVGEYVNQEYVTSVREYWNQLEGA